jgi:hypothetical protein
MARKKSSFNFDKTIAGFNITETGIKSYSKTFKIGPFSQTINFNLQNGKVRGTTSLPGTGLAKRYDLPSLDSFQVPNLPEYKRKPDMWSDNE